MVNSIKTDTHFAEFSADDILNADSSSRNDDIEVSDTLDENRETDL